MNKKKYTKGHTIFAWYIRNNVMIVYMKTLREEILSILNTDKESAVGVIHV